MNEADIATAAPEIDERSRIGHGLALVAKGFAIFGGFAFFALVAMSLVSIIGRKLGAGPVNGDIELMQMGTAVAAAALMPYCTVMDDQLKVEFFTEHVRPRLRAWLNAIGNLLLAVLFLALTWRTALQVADIKAAGEVSTLLSVPIWMPMAAIVPSLALAAVCSLHTAWIALHTRELAP